MAYNQEKSLIKANSKMVHVLNLANKDYKSAIMDMFKEWKENMIGSLRISWKRILSYIKELNRNSRT